jgi:phage FluMu protein Com
VEGTVLIKRICGHSSPYTFKPNERYARDRFQKFLSKKCPQCTLAAIQALEAQQKANAAQKRVEDRQRKETLGKETLARKEAASAAQISAEIT